MPQSEAKFKINQFTGGLVTDANPLADAGPISISEDNCDLMFHGGRRRRRAAALEAAFSLNTAITEQQKQDWAFDTFEWRAVAGVAGLEFLVYQQGSTLYFYDKSTTVVSQGIKTFTVDLTSFKVTAATTSELENTRVSVATGKGVLFVCGKTIEPFHIQYVPATDTIITTQINIKVRDFEEQAPEIGPQDEVVVVPQTTGQHLYDLLNQGWYHTGPFLRDGGSTNRDKTAVVALYQSVENFLPRKNTPWHIGKYIVPSDSARVSDTFISPQQVRSAPSGNELAPFGHYILDAFNKDRAQAVRDEGDVTIGFEVANLDDLQIETKDERPVATSFYAGRSWYLLNNNIYFSQQLDQDSLEKAGKCYQDGDPTNEGTSDVLATDGGLIPVPDMGRGIAFGVTDSSIIVFADNGIWAISGTSGSSFTAVDFTVNKISTISCQSPASIVTAEGLLFFWGETGVYSIQPGDVRDIPKLQDIAEQRITEFYNAIPQAAKRNSKVIYDPEDKVVRWMYKASNDSAGVDVNRFAYDRFLNFSLKFSAFFPWSIDATSTHQIVGGTVASGVLTTFKQETLTDSSLVDMTNSAGDPMEILVASSVEARNRFKPLVLNSNQATFGEFTGTSFLDWNETGTGTNYNSFIETFYHIQDDTMAYMQAPYVYVYFKKTEETPLPQAEGPFVFNDFQNGGLTFTKQFISTTLKNSAALIDNPDLHPQAAYIIGEDGKRYQFDIGGAAVGEEEDNLRIYDVDTGVRATALNKDHDTILTELTAIGVVPPSGGYVNSTGDISSFGIPNTPYIVIIGSQASGVSTSKFIAYYRITSTSTLELVGGYSGRTGALDVQFSPEKGNANAYQAAGFIKGLQTSLPSSNSRATTHNTVSYQYPLAVAYFGEGRSTIMAIPSINAVINGAVSNENLVDHWLNREDDITSSFDAAIFRLEDTPHGIDMKSRGFFLPSTSGSKLYIKWYQADIDAHLASTETRTSTFLQTHDSTYTTGFISSIGTTVATASDAFGFTSTSSGLTVGAHTDFTGYPFTDETDNYDGSAGTSTNNYYLNPSVYPIYEDNIDGPWLLFFPKVFRSGTDTDKLQVNTFIYNPLTGKAHQVDTKKGQIIDFATDLGTTGWGPKWANLNWNRLTGKLTVQILYDKAGETHLVTTEFGKYEPQINGVNDFFSTVTGNPFILESSCLLNTRWDWANTTTSGKISNDLQIYRGGRLHFVSDPLNPTPTGLPVLVSKTKTKGRGRVMQLKFRSEQGKDFELYGWAVWSAKNKRF